MRQRLAWIMWRWLRHPLVSGSDLKARTTPR